MIRNYLKLTIRNFQNQKGYSFLNVSGLAIGMACCILIFLFIKDELSYDRYHENSDRIYRLANNVDIGGKMSHFAIVPYAVAPAFRNEIPEIESFVRIRPFGQRQVIYNNNKYEETGFFATDSLFFKIFTHKFIHGNSETALSEPGSIVITEDVANRLFGEDNPIGKVIKIQPSPMGTCKISGVIKNVPPNSHFRFQYIFSFKSFPPANRGFLNNWINISGWTYFLLKPNVNIELMLAKIPEIFDRNTGEQVRAAGIKFEFFVEKLTDIYLNSKLQQQIGETGNKVYVYTFSLIAIFILVIACVNFINLSTARSTNRSKEVGLRKVFGAFKKRLITQFLSESIITAVISLILALILVFAALPAFNNLSNKELTIASLNNITTWLVLIGIVIFSGLVAGTYPAFILSSFSPIVVLGGHSSQGRKTSTFRKILVILQFSISIILMVSTLAVLEQIKFMQNKELGFNKEQVALIRIKNFRSTNRRAQIIKHELMQNANVKNVSFSSAVPGRVGEWRLFIPEGGNNDDTHGMHVFRVDFDFIKTYQMKINAGRDFFENLASDSTSAFILNETAAKTMDWTAEEAIEKEFEFAGNKKGRIIGVMDDFHFTSLKNPIGPAVFMFSQQVAIVSVRINSDKISEAIKFLEKTWNKFEPNKEFDFTFLDENFRAMYQAEERLSVIFKIFSVLAIFIACLGLFGLASFTAEKRKKEIGVRKVVGASVRNIVTKFSREFTLWVLIANLIAWPFSWIIMSRWLENFAYRNQIPLWIYIVAGILAFSIVLVTVSYQAVKAASANPVESLRYE